jgi:Fe-S cluster assembly protein SufD
MNHSEHTRTAIESVEQAYRQRLAIDAGAAWLQPLRDRAIEAFTRRGFPTPRDEDWKYTNLTALADASGALLSVTPSVADADTIDELLRSLPINAADCAMIFVNGAYRDDLSRQPDAGTGIRITTLAAADEATRGQLRDRLGTLARVDEQQLTALNTAFMSDGLAIEIEAHAHPKATIHAVFLSDQQQASYQPRLLIDAGEHSRATVIEYHAGRQAGWTNAVTEIHCAAGAQLSYVKLQVEDDAADHIATQQVRLDTDSRFHAVHLDFGARLARNDLTVRMTGSGSQAALYGLFLADGKRHVDNHTRIDHLAVDTTSVENYRGILNDAARGVFNGKIIVHEGADRSDARMSNRNLLLSKTAEIDTKPELEIYTDDVKCAHGATTGQLDDNALFYLRARGIPHALARRMLVLAFAREIVAQLDEGATDLAEYIDLTLERRLPE